MGVYQRTTGKCTLSALSWYLSVIFVNFSLLRGVSLKA